MNRQKNSRQQALFEQLKPEHLPRHVAIIMDGNGRWASQRHFGRIRGHRAGIRSIRAATRLAAELKIGYLTLYAFSTENWNRPSEEIEALWGLLIEYLEKEVPELVKQGIRLQAIGKVRKLPQQVRQKLKWAIQETRKGQGLTLVLALNYGGRDEIVEAVRSIARRYQEGQQEVLSAATIEAALYTAGMPDPDLLIRTSGEKRLSNFLLWQLSYAELCFLDVLWPDFDQEHFLTGLLEYQSRERRYGGVGSC